MDENNVAKNSFKAWVLASRPKTLSGAAVPVVMGLSLAVSAEGWGGFHIVPAVLCLLFALVMQVDANFVNDYFDFVKGSDDEQRLGPKRACAQGWVSIRAMRGAIVLITALACIIGLPLIFYGGAELILVGVACVIFCFLYTTLMSYHAMGDILVLLFFGIIPVCFTYYIQTSEVNKLVICSSLACGLVIDTLLVVNNYRDRENDARVGKKTLVVYMGGRVSESFYLALGIAACLLGIFFLLDGHYFTFLLPFVYLALHIRTYKKMKRIGRGKALNGILAENSRNMLLYGLLFCMGVLADTFVEY